jgi:LPPG:FO 2-phospho-L-lactate transferase
VRVVLLAGGGGGARFARGLAAALEPGELTVIANVGDDLEHLGLSVSPDLDSLLYTLVGLMDDERGWGRAHESWNALESVAEWGGEVWFRLGDRDLGLHLVRTELLRDGVPLSEVTRRLCRRAGVETTLLPATDDRLRTHVETAAGTFPFQEWFVGRRHADAVEVVRYVGEERAQPGPGVLEAIAAADAIVLAPSNPYLSLGPILAVTGIRKAIATRRVRSVAISPLSGGRAFTGPLDRMLRRMAGGTEPRLVAQCYEGLVDALVIDEADAGAEADVELVVAPTRMSDRDSEERLAAVALEAACT